MRVLYVSLSFVLICAYAATGWAVWEHRARVQWTKQAEAVHERSVNEWIDHLVAVHDRIDNAIAVQTTSPLYKTHMMHVWLGVHEALGDIDQWPVAYGVTNNVRSLLQYVRSTSYAHATQAQKSSDVWDHVHRGLGQLIARVKDVEDTLHAKHVVWARQHAASTDGWSDGSAMHALAQLDASIGRMHLVPEQQRKPSPLERMSDARIVAKALAMTHADAQQVQRIVHEGTKSDAPSVTVHIRPNMAVEYAVHGGRLLTYDAHRTVRTSRITIAQAIDNAEQFAKKHGFGHVATIGVDAYDNTVHVQTASVRDGVTIYPQRIAMTVARDDGNVMMVDASQFWAFSQPVVLHRVPSTPTNVHAQLDAHMHVLSTSQALIHVQGTYVHCYEILGRVHGALIKVFVDVRNGAHVASEHVHEAAIRS